jgi:hypothetical protein
MTTPAEATHKALAGGYRKAVAVRINLSEKSVDAHCTGALTAPVERFIVEQKELAAKGHHDPYALLRYACRELGHFPPVPMNAKVDPSALDCIAKVLKESSDITAQFAAAHGDGIFNVADAENILTEVEDMLGVLGPLALALQQVIAEGEEARERGRRGPHRVLPRFYQLRRQVSA